MYDLGEWANMFQLVLSGSIHRSLRFKLTFENWYNILLLINQEDCILWDCSNLGMGSKDWVLDNVEESHEVHSHA